MTPKANHWFEIYNMLVDVRNNGRHKLLIYPNCIIKARDNPSFVEFTTAMRFRYFYGACA